MPVRRELNLQVALGCVCDEDLVDLMLPQPVGSAERAAGGRVAEEWTFDLDAELKPGNTERPKLVGKSKKG